MAAPTLTLKTLQQAVKGLTYPSEQDRPVKAVFWTKSAIGDAALDADLVKKQAKADVDAKVATQSVADFFKPVTVEQSWQSDTEKAAVHQFQAVQTLLTPLADLTVFCIGDTDQQVYVLGKTPDGDIAGISTVVIAT